MTIKTCTKCLLEKPVTQYYKHEGGKFGVKSRCKACCNSANSKWKKNNPKAAKAIAKRSEKKNFESISEYRKTYRKVNRAYFRSKSMGYYAAKKQAAPSWLTQEQKNLIDGFYEQARDCELVSGFKYHVDHIVPLQGENVCGLHVPWNLQVLPACVNISKSNKYDPSVHS